LTPEEIDRLLLEKTVTYGMAATIMMHDNILSESMGS
jgi:hypothetical protein